MSLTITNTFTAGSTIVAADINTNFTDVSNKFGNIDNSDIKSGAAIDVDKLSAQYQEKDIVLVVHQAQLAAGWPAASATTPLAVIPIPGSNGDTAWTATDVSWVCTDTGDGAGDFDVRYGEFNSTGVWTNTASVVTTVSMTNANAANDANDGKALEGGSVSLPFATTSRGLAIMSSAASATTLAGGTGKFLAVTVTLRRKISA